MPPGGSCLLGSINLAEFVKNPFTNYATFDYDSFEETVRIAIDGLNEILDEGMELHPLEEQRNSVRDWRQIGLGIFGLADMLIKMRICYGSKESIDLCNAIGDKMARVAIKESETLAYLDGKFPKCNMNEIMKTEFFKAHVDDPSVFYQSSLRNSQLLTIAPTGTLSTMLGVSGGIEPIFANSYNRTTKSLHGEDVTYKVYTPIVQEYMEHYNITDEEELPYYFITAQDIHYKDRIAMQATWQNHIDASISSTVNLPNDATKEDVFNIYIEAWKAGLKGVTIFRDGCSRTGILTTEDTNPEAVKEVIELPRGSIIEVDDNVIGLKRKLITGCGSLHVSAFFDPVTGDLLETYLSKGSTGGCLNSLTGLSRMISLSARAGVSIHDIVDQLDSSGSCPSYAVRSATKKDTSKGSCCPVAVGKALMDMYNEMHDSIYCDDEKEEEDVISEIKSNITIVHNTKSVCPECGEPLAHEGGCDICKNCGFSKCG